MDNNLIAIKDTDWNLVSIEQWCTGYNSIDSAGETVNNFTSGYYDYHDYYPDIVPIVYGWYPTYIPVWLNESKMEKSFMIIQKLMEKNIVKNSISVKTFIELVTEISQIL